MSGVVCYDRYTYIYEEDGRWWVNVNGRKMGPFLTRAEAFIVKLASQ